MRDYTFSLIVLYNVENRYLLCLNHEICQYTLLNYISYGLEGRIDTICCKEGNLLPGNGEATQKLIAPYIQI